MVPIIADLQVPPLFVGLSFSAASPEASGVSSGSPLGGVTPSPRTIFSSICWNSTTRTNADNMASSPLAWRLQHGRWCDCNAVTKKLFCTPLGKKWEKDKKITNTGTIKHFVGNNSGTMDWFVIVMFYSLRAKLLIGNIEISVSTIHIIPPSRHDTGTCSWNLCWCKTGTCSFYIESVSCVLVSRRHKEPRHQQLWYRLAMLKRNNSVPAS